MKKIILSICALAFISVNVYAKISIVTTTTDLADIAQKIGGDKVNVVSLSHGDQSGCQGIEPRPSMLMNLRKADVLILIGMDYDHWANGLIDASRNSNIVFGAPGYIDTSVGIRRLEVPVGKVDASMGHVHIYGNPHYILDPDNGKIVARNIAEGLSKKYPEHKVYFKTNEENFVKSLDAKIKEWDKILAPFRGREIVSYHKTWEYLAEHFGFKIIAYIEPKPGIPPSPAHLNRLIEQLKTEKGVLIFHENIYPLKSSEMVAKETGAKVLVLPMAVKGLNGKIQGYLELFDYITGQIAEAK